MYFTLKKIFTFTSLFFLIFPTILCADGLTVRYPAPESSHDTRYEYPEKLLELALRKTVATHGTFTIAKVRSNANKARLGEMLRQGSEIDIIWHAENGKLSADYLPIRIPVFKGLVGFRVLLINKADQPKFDEVTDIDGLRRLTLGFGHSWADRKVLEDNRLPLVPIAEYERIFKMLDGGRFDYFPRGINEAWRELDARKEQYPDMRVEDSLLLYYRLPIYFVVNKSNKALAERIETGLRSAIADGSFDALFNSFYGEIIEKANISSRRLIVLQNRDLPTETLDDEIFWLESVKH